MTNSATRDEIKRHRMRLIVPMAIALILLGGYTVFWFQGAKIMRAEIAAWIAEERAEGREVNHGPIRVRGFPGSLRAEVDAPRWAEPGEWAWGAETLYVITEPFNPRRLVLAPRGVQQVAYDGKSYAVRAEDLRVGLSEGAVAVDARGLTAEGEGAVLNLGGGRVNWSEAEGGALLLSVGQLAYANGNDAYAVPQLNAALSGSGDGLGLDAFEGALRIGAADRPVLLTGEGRVGIDDAGYPSGRMTVEMREAESLGPVLAEAGLIEPTQAGLIDMAVASLSGADGTASVPLAFRDGRLRVSGFAVADLPKIAESR